MPTTSRSHARDPYEAALLAALARRSAGGFVFFIGCTFTATFFEVIRFPERRPWMLGFAAGMLALTAIAWSVIRRWPGTSLWTLIVFVNVVGVLLNAYHVIVAASVAICLWTLTGLVASSAVILRWGGANQAMAALGALLSYPVHLEAGVVDPWTWAAGGTYLVTVVGMSVFGAALSEREARLQSYFDLAPIGTAVLGRDGTIGEINDELCRILGCGREQALGRTWPPFGDPEARAAETAFAAAALAGARDTAPRETTLFRRDGARAEVAIGMRGLPGAAGPTDHVMAVVQDVAAHRRADADREAMLARELVARQEAERASRAKDLFLATLSHELRTPLTPILSWAHVLRRGGLAEADMERAIAAIERNAEAQSRLVGDLLDVSRIMAGKLVIVLAPLDLGTVLQDALDVVRPAARARGVTLHLENGGQPCVVEGDADRLRQVFCNLLSNAVKFTPSGGHVEVGLTAEGRTVRVVVRDTGQGIAPDFLPHVFERFRQAESGPRRAQGGLGLGLAIVREVVALHGGAVTAASEGEGKGATFTVELPVAAQTARVRRPAGEPAGEPLRGVRVLLVDDDYDAREALRFLLARSGAEVEAAATTRQAIDLLARRPPDVLVSDIAMPEEDGYAFLGRVRAGEGGRPDVPAIALTAYSAPEDRERALSHGFQAHVSKPVELAKLVAAVQAVRGNRAA